MARERRVDLCVVGAGSAGLSVAAVAAQIGVSVVLIERDRMGGECLNTGCVPSKALLAAAKTAQTIRNAKAFGIDATPAIDFVRVHAYVRAVIEAIAPHDSVDRFIKLGVDVIEGEARFIDSETIVAGGREIHPRRTVIATGSEPAIPPIPGLDQVEFFTNQNIFDNKILPKHLVILGGGPIGFEIGQAYRRLGSAVTILERDKAMLKDDQELVRSLLEKLTAEGVIIRQGIDVKSVHCHDGEIDLTIEEAGQSSQITGTHLFVATGRKPRVAGLALGAAGVEHGERGIVVDKHLQTTRRGIYAAGDVIDGPHFTHVCSYHAGIVIKNALFRLPAKVDYVSLPWVTYTDPELAQIGMTEGQARDRHGDEVRVVRVPYTSNDRAQTERHADGMLKLVATRSGRVLGASILGVNAGELAHLWVVAIEQKLKLRDIAQMIAPYPTWSELNKAAAAEFSKPLLSSRPTRIVAQVLSWLP